MADSQRGSQRQGHKPIQTGEDPVVVLKERLFLVTFFFGAISLVAGMLWIADGLSDNFKVTTTTFIVFAVAAGLSATSAIVSKVLTRNA